MWFVLGFLVLWEFVKDEMPMNNDVMEIVRAPL